MSLLLSCQDIAKRFGSTPLFSAVSLGFFAGDRVGLVGPNGAGKSTLLKILAGLEVADSGKRSVRKNLRLAYVAQENSFTASATVEEIVSAALEPDAPDPDERHARVGTTLARVGFEDTSAAAATLSGGWRKRLAIACALVRAPDLLLMDEPTNHLDVQGILWLEKLLRLEALAYVVVSHDRYFLENVTNRIVEVNSCYPEGYFDVRGNYSSFLAKKDELLHNQRRYQEVLGNRVRRELEWLKRGPKARTRKSGARIEEAAQLQNDLAKLDSRMASRSVRLELNASERKTKRLVVVDQIEKRFAGKRLFGSLSFTLTPGMCLGILGRNGSGKTTLLQILAGEVQPDAGRVEAADDLKLVFLDQHRQQLDGSVSLRRALAPVGDQVVYNGKPLHVAAWARRFLFPPEQLDMPLERLSGGERARVALARLLLQPADVLILDEPTNDLDIPTLEVLEEGLLEFSGAVVLVTHDRFLFERVTTTVLALDGNGETHTYADYAQWLAASSSRVTTSPDVANPSPAPKPRAGGVKRLTYKERREWEQMEAIILAAEQTVAACQAATLDTSVAADAVELQRRYTALSAAQAHVDHLYQRWAELEAKVHAS